MPVHIERINIGWFNRLVLEGAYLEDETGKTLFEANHVSAGFEFLPLLKKKFVFTTVRVFGFSMNLEKEHPEDVLNLQFLINAFASKDTTKERPDIDLRFNSILLRKGHFSYHIASEKETLGKFNAKHIDIDNVSANISLKAFNKDSLNAYVKRLSFTEASGFTLDKLSLNLISNHDSAYIDNFEVQLPETKLKIDKATMNIASVDGLTSFLNDAPIELSIAPSRIYLKELSPFIPAFSNYTDTIQLAAKASGYINNIDLSQLTIRQGDKMSFNGMMELKGITNPLETYLFGRVNQLHITTEGITNIINNFSDKQTSLPEAINKIGSINFTGEISGFFDNLVAFGKFTTSIGSINTDIIFGHNKEKNIANYVKGHISTSDLSINELFNDNNPYGNARFDLTIDASRPVNGTFAGNIQGEIEEFEFKEYTYEHILLSGNFKKNGFDGLFHLNDPNGEVKIEGMFEHQGQNSIYNFTAEMNHFRPDKLNLTQKYESPEISFSLHADFTGDNIDNLAGNIQVDKLTFHTEPSNFFLDQLKITASGYAEDRKLTIASDILNGEVAGAYSFYTIIPSLFETFGEYLPAVTKVNQKKQLVKENNFYVLLTIENTDSLSATLKLPATIVSQSRITGHYNNRYNKFRLEGWFPKFKIGNSNFESGYLSCDNPGDKVDFQLKAVNYNNTGTRNYLNLKADAKDNKINSSAGWSNNKERMFNADISTSTLFVEDTDDKGKPSLRTEVSIDKSSLVVNDTLWTIIPAAITLQNGKVDIDNFMVNHENQHIHLDGTISKDASDTLYLNLQQIELSYIFEVLDIPVLQFGGEATGSFNITDLHGNRILNTDLEVQDFSFNQVQLGRLNLFSEWDDEQRGILMLGTIYKNDSIWTDVSGYIYPVNPNQGLSLYFDANDIDISFLQPFLIDVAKDLKGRGFGLVHLFGPFKELTIEGDAYVQDAGMGIEFLNTYYTFSDSVHMVPGSINLHNTPVYDKFGNSGKVSLQFNHKYFKDYDFLTNIQVNNMLVYDQTERNMPLMYGTAFGSGSATIKGNKNLIDFDINMRSEHRTEVALNFMKNSASDEYNFITFVDKKQQAADSAATDSIKLLLPAINEGAEMKMNFLLDVTPDATIDLIMDPGGGDRIKGNAVGSLQVQYGTKSDLRMYGGVDIVDGIYNFSLQQLIHRDFKIREGSTISFQGDPFNASMKVNAIYNLTANISDLDQGLLMETSRPNVPVNCVLKLDGMLRNPNISFDIELPNSNEELQRQVRSFINTEDMMTRQIVYLLVLSKFYTPDYTSNLNKSTNEFSAVASSAISAQLSSILNSITDKVQIGTNIRAGQDVFSEDTEVEMLLSSQLLDNRLLFNGNFGYRNSHIQQKSVFIGEFDLEYKLIPSGEIRLKAYNHTNDMQRYLKNSMTTQGVGIMFKKDFTHPMELFRRKKKLMLPSITTNNKTEEPVSHNETAIEE